MHGGGSSGGGDGGHRDAGGPGDAGSLFTGTLRISPRSASVEVGPGLAAAPVPFTATADGLPVTPRWSAAPSALGSIDTAGRFTASGTVPGEATITAGYGAATDSVTVSIRLHLSQNGSVDAGYVDAGPESGVGGVGGVGGEGEGGPVDAATLAVLQSTPTDGGMGMLYPYEGTVWPQDILAPLLQWQNGANPPQAVAIHLECPAFTWDGSFAQTATPFLHHPIPLSVWRAMGSACANQHVTLRLVFAAGGVAYGPLTQTWTMSAGSLKGVVYYNSYGTKLASNFSGALPNGGAFGGATLAVHGGSTDPVLVAGKSGGVSDCRVCHVVSADGSTLLSQHGDDYSASSTYALTASNAETPLSPADGRYAWGALSPNGSLLFSNAAPLYGATTQPSALYALPAGTPVATTGLPAGLQAGTPVFSPDGTRLAFNWYGGTVDGGAGDARTLATMRFTPPGTFSEFTSLFTPAGSQVAVYPSFLPSGTGVIFENQVQSNGRGFAETRSSCDDSTSCSDVGARGEIWWADLASGQAHRLDALDGLGLAPSGDNGHDDDSTLNYEPTVSPIASGGYAWVIFTSRRLYGNVATLNPFWSDPRFHDISQSPTTKKLWVAAVDLNAPAGTDPSHPAFYLPAQELLAGNSRGYWALSPCKDDGQTCESGDECCGGFCRTVSELGAVCGSSGTGCAQEFEKCTTDADCCNATTGLSCINGHCAVVFR